MISIIDVGNMRTETIKKSYSDKVVYRSLYGKPILTVRKYADGKSLTILNLNICDKPEDIEKITESTRTYRKLFEQKVREMLGDYQQDADSCIERDIFFNKIDLSNVEQINEELKHLFVEKV